MTRFTKFYRGHPDGVVEIVRVYANSQSTQALDPRLDLANKSPSGFAWGYLGSGPSQLALALLADALGDEGTAERLMHPFKELVLARIPDGEPWVMSDNVVRALAAACAVRLVAEG